ncbi:MAG: L-2-hydroxyglutarate oxidase [Nitrospinae bacterium CG11_big_fil_rev_8_21_14_0_20_45_15]|nr:MAG: L-2-hydroxyglutarate oxidase [Nitrospinae bacterium CG11_big_fil_rev_8_21_14_0_20_45_15]
MKSTQFLIIGGGVIGLNVARELKRRYPDERVLLTEKESQCGTHASGRNSGVLHAGFYYSADSLKAKFTRDGNQRMTAYCKEKKLKINPCGKLVVAKDESELPWLDELLSRAKTNGVELKSISEQEAREIEPRVKTFQRALFSPTTSSVDPGEVMLSMKQDALAEGVEIETGAAYLGRNANTIRTTAGPIEAKYVVNCAGLYADRIGRDFGFSEHYRILPFKGLYLYSNEEPGSLRTNIYPVPDLRNPFLGVHFTVTADGKMKIGPTAIPAFWREQYEGFGRFRPDELAEILFRQMGLFLFSNFDFKSLAFDEIKKYWRRHLVSLSSVLLENVRPAQYKKWGKPGIRAQLLDLRTRTLEMDFVLEGDKHSMHVLNAVSPAFTCALPFAEYVCDRIEEQGR